MDKFDIFKFLTSAYNFYQKNSVKKEENSEEDNSGENFLSKILNATKNNPKKQEEPPIKKAVPLQQNMLYTMKSHEEFVKRVMKNNKKGGK